MRKVIAVLTILLITGAARGQASAPDPRLERRDALVAEANRLQAQGDLAHAHEALSRVLAMEEEIFGEVHEETEATHARLARVEELLDDLSAAADSLKRALGIRVELSGPDDWRTTSARLDLEDLIHRSELPPEKRQFLAEAIEADLEYATRYREGRYMEAVEHAKRSLAIREEVLGQEHRLAAKSLHQLGDVHQVLGKPALARSYHERAFAIREQVLGPEHPETVGSLRGIADAHQSMGDYTKALALYGPVLAIRESVLGPDHVDTASTLRRIAATHVSMGDYDKAQAFYERALAIYERRLGPESLETGVALNDLALNLQRMGNAAQALPLFERALEISVKTRGPEHPDTATALFYLADAHVGLGDYEMAVERHEHVLAIRAKVLGPEHPYTALSLSALGDIHWWRGEFWKARPRYERALAIREKALGPEHPLTGASVGSLAVVLTSIGEYATALPLHERALAIKEKALGPDHPAMATSLNNLADIYQRMGENAKALPLFERALSIWEDVLGPEHPTTALALGNLALCHQSMGHLARARSFVEQALAIREKVLGPDHPATAQSLDELADLLVRMGEPAKAVPLSKRALEINEKVFGPDGLYTAYSLMQLGAAYGEIGDFANARPLLERALVICEGALAPDHPITAGRLEELAAFYGESGSRDLAFPLAVRAFGVRRTVLDSLFPIQAERQQLRWLGGVKDCLDLCVSTVPTGQSGRAHDLCLGAKGLVFRRQAFLREQRARPELAAFFSEYEDVCRDLSSLLLSKPAPGQESIRRERVHELSVRQEELEVELATGSELFREERDSLRLTASALAACLPDGSALVDFLAYGHLLSREPGEVGSSERERRYVAFVVRPDAGTVLVKLGEAAPIDALVEEWRTEVRAGNAADAGRRLRELLWEPLATHVGNARTVLVSPDGALSRIPFAALPGKEPGTWLVDEYAFATVPVPRLLPLLLESDEAESDGGSLLLVGEVDYGAPPGRPGGDLVASRAAPRTGLRGAWEPLAATRAEVLAVRDSFELRFEEGDTRSLRRKRATEESFREAAGAHRWIHVATHGFFAPEEVKSSAEAGAAVHPGVLSGIVLAGANLPVESGRDDGILTALEVASLDFSGTELVTLSACETGLGAVAGGEGVLGLQRAFQMAGARSTVTSLWKVDDEFTRKLMTLFYEKLWDEGLPKAQALRQAQLALMADEGMRGLAVKDAAEGETPTRLPPLYWAGFTLSGDWR